FDNVAPGHYALSAERSGYLNQNFGARGPGKTGLRIDVFDGTHRTDLTITMTPQALISGRITDEDGDPVTEATVYANRIGYSAAGKNLVPAGYTNVLADGSFLLGNLLPGSYYLSAISSLERFIRDPSERPTAANRPPSYATTYYPRATEFSSATPVDVRAGS